MRLFKHGDCLAIVVPNAICKKLDLKENSDLEFFEIEDGVLALASKEYLEKKLKTIVQPFVKATALEVFTFSTQEAAIQASKRFEKEIREGKLIAILASDKKYYFVSIDFYNNIFGKIAPLLESEKSLQDLSKQSGLAAKDLLPVLQIMKEKGELIEKKKGQFLLVK